MVIRAAAYSRLQPYFMSAYNKRASFDQPSCSAHNCAYILSLTRFLEGLVTFSG